MTWGLQAARISCCIEPTTVTWRRRTGILECRPPERERCWSPSSLEPMSSIAKFLPLVGLCWMSLGNGGFGLQVGGRVGKTPTSNMEVFGGKKLRFEGGHVGGKDYGQHTMAVSRNRMPESSGAVMEPHAQGSASGASRMPQLRSS